MNDLRSLILNLKLKGVLKSQKIEDALRKVDRADFVTPKNKEYAYIDNALTIGYGQTISQPYTVVFMLELLKASEGETIMDAGSGSCWQTGLLAHMVGHTGKIYAFEIVKELCNFGIENLKKYPELFERVEFQCKSAEHGVENITKSDGDIKLDKIIAAAELSKIPEKWKTQLEIGGVMVFPKDNGIYRITKTSNTDFTEEFYPGFVFVPFIEEKSS